MIGSLGSGVCSDKIPHLKDRFDVFDANRVPRHLGSEH